MPIYVYTCEDGHANEVFQDIADDRPDAIPCEACDKPATRDLSGEHGNPTKAVYGKWPLRSRSAGISPSQIAEAERRFPEDRGRYDQKTGDVIFHSRQDRRDFLKRHQLVDGDSYTGY